MVRNWPENGYYRRRRNRGILATIAVVGLVALIAYLFFSCGGEDNDGDRRFVFIMETPTATTGSSAWATGTPSSRSTPSATSTPRPSSGSTGTPAGGSVQAQPTRTSSTSSTSSICDSMRGKPYASEAARQQWIDNRCTNPNGYVISSGGTTSSGAGTTSSGGSFPPPDTCYHQVPPFTGRKDIPAGCNVVGDIQLWDGSQFVRKYDDDSTTGLYTSCPAGCTVIADYKSNGTSRTMADLNSKEGCGPGCRFTTQQSVPSTTSGSRQATPATDTCYEMFPSIPAGHTANIPAGCNVIGDIWLLEGGKYNRKYDNDPATGKLTHCPDVCKILAAFHSNASSRSLEDFNSKEGCGTGCKFTVNQTIPSPPGSPPRIIGPIEPKSVVR